MNRGKPVRPRSRRHTPIRRPTARLEGGWHELERRCLPAVITPFAPRFSTNASGDILFVANTLMTATPSDSGATAAQAATGTRLNNNDFTMVYVDVDGVASTFNSSQANLALPAGGSVLFAGLYWGANSAAANRTTALIRAPGAAGYTTLSGISFGADGSNNYQAFADVTSLVRAAGVGTYTVANVQANTGGDRHAGWAMVVAYADPSTTPRNLTVFDGLAAVNSSTPNVTLAINGFTAPPTGTVNANIGFIGYEGDLGLTGDAVKLNNTTLSDALNPANNFFNSTISHKGSRVATKAPDYANQLGFDADVIRTTGVIPNGATSATISLTTGGETFLPGVVTTAIDLYAPVVSASKGVVDLNGGNVEPGDILEYTDTVAVTSGEAATGFILIDAIPANTTYVPGSLQIVSGANAGAKSDGTSDDQAEFDVVNNRVVFRLGTGATATSGGTLGVGATSTVRFRVRVNTNAPNGTAISSQASASFVGQNTGASLAAASSVASTAVIRNADLSLSQVANNPTPNVGDVVTITTTLANAGPFDGTGIQVNALLPLGLQFISATPSQGAYNSATGVWTVGTVVPTGSTTLTLQARVIQPSTITTTASIGAVDQPDPVASNNSATATIIPQRADLTLAKVVDNPRPNVNGRIVFTTTLTNRGPDAATGVVIADALPAGFTLVSTTPSQGSYDPVTGNWNVGTLALGATATLILTADVTSPSASVATASILSSAQFDPIGANNAASAAVTPQQADVGVSTGIDNPVPNVNDIVTYTVTVSNNGPDTATGVRVGSGGFPSGVQILSVTLSQGTFDPATTVWTVGNVGVGDVRTLVVRARVTAPSIAPVTVSVLASDQFDPNSANNSSRTAVNPQESSLSLTNTASNTRPDANEVVTFTVRLRNAGPSAATGVVVGDSLPAGLTFVSATPDRGTYDPSTGNWTVGAVGATEVASLTLVARVISPSPMTSTATILAAAQFDPDSADNSASIVLTPKQSDLRLSLSGDEPRPNVGDVVTLVFTLSNQGPDTATGVRAAGTLPAGITVLSSNPSQGTFDLATGVWTVGTVDTLAPRTLVLQVRVDSAAPLVGTASIAAADQFDPDSSNNGLTVTAIPQRVGLALAQVADKPTPNVGDIVSFAVTLSNAGPDAASGVRVSHVLPAGLSFVAAEPGQGTYDPATGTWVVGTLGAQAQQTLIVRARVTASGAATVSAIVASADQFDADLADNIATTTVTPQRSDLALNLAVSNAAPIVGDQVAFTITLTDAGPDAATGVAVRDLLASGLAYIASTPSQGAYDPTTGIWTAGTINSGTTATLVLIAQVAAPSPFTHTATVVSADQFDPNPGNNAATVSATPQTVDLGIAKTADVARPNVGDIVTLTTTLTNAGPSSATNVLVRSAAGPGTTIVGAETSQGTFDPATGIWDVGNVAALGTQVLRVRVRIDAPNTINSAASIAEVTQFDTVAGNNASSTAITPQRADVGLSQTVDVATPNVGQFVTFTITASNVGPDSATGVSVRDLLPSGLQFISSTQSQGGYNPTTGLWTIGTVAPGSPQVLRIVARVASPGTTINTAAITSADQFDPVAANNTASVANDPQQADLNLVASFNTARPNVGDFVTYTVTLTDAGPAAATAVAVAAPLPAGLTFFSAAPSQGSYDPATGLWTVGAVAAGGPTTLTITAQVTATTTTTATAAIAAADQFDPSASNNIASTSFTPQRANLTLTTAANLVRPNVGDVVTLSLSLANSGPDAATGVVISSLLPAGLVYLGSSGPGAYDPTAGSWALGTIASGGMFTLLVQARVATPAPQVVAASVASADQFDPISADNASSITLVPNQSDLSLGVVVDRPAPNVGDLVTFTITVANSGPDNATGIRIRDVLPAGFSLSSTTPSQGLYSQASGIWEVGQVVAGASATLIVQATVIAPGTMTNAVSILAADQFDPNPADNATSSTVVTQQSDLSLTASASTTTPNVGDVVTVTLSLANVGPDAATGVRVADLIPAGLRLISATPSLGVFDATTGSWILAGVPSGATPTLTLAIRVETPSAATTVATIVAADQHDPDLDDRAAGVTFAPQRADLALNAAVNTPTPNVGDEVDFTFTLVDIGPDGASGVSVAVPLPAGYTLVTATPGTGTYDPVSGIWTVGSVVAGVPAVLTLSARVDSDTPAGVSATIIAANQFDPSSGNNAASASIVPQRADLGVAVTVSDPTPNVNDTITYTIYLGNSGPDIATGITLRDLLPAGVTLVTPSPSQGTYDPATGIWTVGSLAPGAQAILSLSAQVTDPAATVNRVEILDVDQFDPYTANDSAETSTAPLQSELRLTGLVDRPRPNVGETVTFTLSLANLGPDDATNITIDAALPTGLTFASAIPGVGIYDPASGIWTLAGLAEGATTTLIITAVASSSAPSVFAATIRQADQFDPNLADNRAETRIHPLLADLIVSSAVDSARPNVGDVVTFTVTIANAGPDAATGLLFAQPLPTGLVFVSASGGAGAYDPITGNWAIGTLASGASSTLVVSARVASPGTIASVATIAAVDQFDPNGGNNAVTVTLTPQASDLFVTAVADRPRPNVGDVVTITVNLGNSGPDAATGARIATALPPGLTFVSATPSRGTYDPVAGIWSVDSVSPGATGILVLRATVVSPAGGTVAATLLGADQFDPNASNGTGSASIVPLQSDLTAGLVVDAAAPNVGDVITLTATLTNSGPDASAGIVVIGSLPAGLAFEGADPDAGEYSPSTGIWSVGTVAPGTTLNLRIRVRVVDPSPQAATVTVSSSDQFDPDPADNSASVTVVPRRSDLSLTSTVDVARPNVGDLVTITVTLADSGPDSASGVLVASALPSGLAFVSANPDVGTYDPSTGVWTAGIVTSGSPRTLVLVARVTDPQSIVVTTAVAAADQFDPDLGNNLSTVTIAPQRAELTLNTSVDDLSPVAGQVITFTVTLTNRGPDAATGVLARGVLPPGLEFISAGTDGGTFDTATASWIVGTLASGSTVTLRVSARAISPDTSLATIAVVAADQFGAAAGVQGSITILPQQSDLDVAIVANMTRPNVGDVVTLRITVGNAGIDAATGVALGVPLPAGLTFVSAEPGLGSYDPATGRWTIGTLATGFGTVLTILARVASPSGVNVSASVISVDQFDPDASGNVASALLTPRAVDLALRLEGLPDSVTVGQIVVSRIVATNGGPDGATGVVIPISIPSGFRPITSSASAGTYDPATGLWTLVSLPGGGTETLVLTLEAVTPGNASFGVGPAQSDQFDRDPANGVVAGVVAVAVPLPPENPGQNPNGSLSGTIFTDLDGDRAFDPGEPVLPGQTILLEGVDAAGNVVRRATTTADDGAYRFEGLAAGTYSVLVSATTGSATGVPGTLGGQASVGGILGIPLEPSNAGGGYNFAVAAADSSLAGRVYVDLRRDGRYGPGDVGVATARVVLAGLDSRGNRVRLVTRTASDGSFNFNGLRPGRYAVRSSLPGFLKALRARPGTSGGIARRVRIREIQIAPGVNASGYEFGSLPRATCQLFPLVARSGSRAASRIDEAARSGAIPRGPLIHRFVPRLDQALRAASPGRGHGIEPGRTS